MLHHSSHNVSAFYGHSDAFVSPAMLDVSQDRRGGNCNLKKLTRYIPKFRNMLQLASDLVSLLQFVSFTPSPFCKHSVGFSFIFGSLVMMYKCEPQRLRSGCLRNHLSSSSKINLAFLGLLLGLLTSAVAWWRYFLDRY